MSSRTALICVVLITNLPLPTEAHDIYSHLRSPRGESCCDDRDCRPAPYRVIAGHWQMFVDRRWIDVPDDTIQYRALPDDQGETGGGHWCGFSITPTSEEDREPVYTTRCAILPPQAAEADLGRLGMAGQ
ncbi:hypothetical protein [Microvirga tunisiensis]|uniref:Uncharacterized protein n=1 Tax=Microvirga tunisiensis TaxID=2108360 RepID=A0A5N7MSX1_9HYPH|nr:hypothetical protein [Microvirga tunisiensis]MPR12146.1 hypothetical protein [Microvirga tunisiensis]MPR30101.1 hypothetical protein [Microvirga tunisiensis]